MLSELLLPYLRWPPRPYVVLDAISRHDSDRQQYSTLQAAAEAAQTDGRTGGQTGGRADRQHRQAGSTARHSIA